MEFVYVVKEKDLDRIGPAWTWWNYFEPGTSFCKYIPSKKNRVFLENILDNGFFMERAKAEKDPDFKQIIPYCVIARGDKVFMTERLNVGEKRLQGKISIGTGGHINPVDIGKYKPDLLTNCILRELNEETNIGTDYVSSLVGFLYDDIDDVSSVHLGLVYRISPAAKILPDLQTIEVGELKGKMVPKSEAIKMSEGERMEHWSKVVITQSGLFK